MSSVVKAYQVHLKTEVEEKKLVQPIHFDKVQKAKAEAMAIKNEAVRLLENAKKEASSIIEEAKETAKKLLEDARQEIAEMRAIVLEEAREQGFQEGHREVLQQAEVILKEAEDIKVNAQREYQALLERAESDIIQMVLDISKKIIGDELDSRPDRISSLTAQALAECKGAESAVIKVSPEDYQGVVENTDCIVRTSGYSGQLEIKQDMALEKGDCIIETPNGNIDASVKVQLQELEKNLISN